MKYFNLSFGQKSYLAKNLNRVSRSFAVVIPFLNEPLDGFIAVAYLLARLADNIEDCDLSLSRKRDRFAELKQLLSEPAQYHEILEIWENKDWPGLTDDEKAMMSLKGGGGLWEIYEKIPGRARDVISYWVSYMAQGMENVLDLDLSPDTLITDGVRILADQQAYNQYCYIVAGTVGSLSTELAVQHYSLKEETAQRMRRYSDASGRALQKTNIIKDFVNDLSRGICYLPHSWLGEMDFLPLSLKGATKNWVQHVLYDALSDINESVKYVLEIPYEASGFRMACLMCLLPAYQTLLNAGKLSSILFTSEHNIKISRDVFFQCRKDAKSLTADNQLVLQYQRSIEREMQSLFSYSLT